MVSVGLSSFNIKILAFMFVPGVNMSGFCRAVKSSDT